MLVKVIPQLEDGLILKRQMLKAIADAAFLTSEYLYKGYADGILSGCGPKVAADMIVIEEGAVLLGGQIFLIRESPAVSYAPADRTMVLKMCFSNEVRDAGCIYREMDIKLTEQTAVQKGELELCRFRLQEGAVLRCRYQDFEDRSTEYDTLNTIHVPYAAMGQATLSAGITRAFARELLEVSGISDFDALFCLQILGQRGPVGKEALKGYIGRRKKEELTDLSNLNIYRELTEILRQAKGFSAEPEAKKSAQRKWKVMVD